MLGVVPYFTDIRVPEEDSAALQSEYAGPRQVPERSLRIAVIKFPYLSNFTDFDALKGEPDVSLYYAGTPEALSRADVIILPGTKNTLGDLRWLKETGFAAAIRAFLKNRPRGTVVGICGGFQMLGREVRDEHGVESAGKNSAALSL